MKGTTIAILVVLIVIAYLIWKATQPKTTSVSTTATGGVQRIIDEKGEEPYKCTLVSANGRQVTITSEEDSEFFRQVCRGERTYYVQGVQYWPRWLYFPGRPHYPHPFPHPTSTSTGTSTGTGTGTGTSTNT